MGDLQLFASSSWRIKSVTNMPRPRPTSNASTTASREVNIAIADLRNASCQQRPHISRPDRAKVGPRMRAPSGWLCLRPRPGRNLEADRTPSVFLSRGQSVGSGQMGSEVERVSLFDFGPNRHPFPHFRSCCCLQNYLSSGRKPKSSSVKVSSRDEKLPRTGRRTRGCDPLWETFWTANPNNRTGLEGAH